MKRNRWLQGVDLLIEKPPLEGRWHGEAMTERCWGSCDFHKFSAQRTAVTPLSRAARASSPQGEPFAARFHKPSANRRCGTDAQMCTYVTLGAPLLIHYSRLPIHSQKRTDLLSQIGSFLCWRYLSSRAVTRKVLSAKVSLTSVFGMGTGGPSPQSTPTASKQIPYPSPRSKAQGSVTPLLLLSNAKLVLHWV